MITGIMATVLTFVALMLSVVAYYLYDRRREESLLTFARTAFYAAGVLIVFQTVLLLYGILAHHFEWSYVFSYSSRDLSLFYLISTFWAGQEGTFLLWLLFGVIYGLWILHLRKEDEPMVMSFFNLIMAFIAMILIKKNPFTYVWEINPINFAVGVIPPDGAGLNPLLQDPWMVIHPPVMFAGYSATMLPFSFALTALVKRNYDNWVKPAFPFVVFTAMTLGAGIILGGYWAYTTLGWGGYWAWDPVENSSLIPWLFSLALIHGLLIQKRQGGMKKINLLLSIMTFILVLWGSFLTRSGILTDFSVHSFGESEISSYLIGFVLLFMAIGLLIFLFRVNEVKYHPVHTDLATRESFMNLGILILVLMGIFTLVGTSWPLLSGLFKEKAESFAIEYYNYMAGPFAVLMAVLIAISPLLRWKSSSWDKLRTVAVHAVISFVLGIIFFFAGVKQIIPLLIMTLSVFMILINGQLVIKMLRKKNWGFGGYLVHTGLGLMMIGIITSSVYDHSVKTTFPKDMPKEVFGYEIVYQGRMPAANGKDHVVLMVDGKKTMAKFYWSDYSQAWMVGPSVENKWIRDLYISPIQIIPPEDTMTSGHTVTLIKGQKTDFHNFLLLFKAYDMNSHQMGADEMMLKAIVEIYDKNSGELVGEIRPGISIKGDDRQPLPATFVDNKSKVFLNGINVEQKSITIVVNEANETPEAGKEILAAEVTIKPFINILWLGTVIMLVGFLFSLYYRFNERRK
ncbi:heme lyase CcmF/NrfE family subunit [Caldithrix abyssi]